MVRKADIRGRRMVYGREGGPPEDVSLNDGRLFAGVDMRFGGHVQKPLLKLRQRDDGSTYYSAVNYLRVMCGCGQQVAEVRRGDAADGGSLDFIVLQIAPGNDASPAVTRQVWRCLGEDAYPVDCTGCGRRELDGRGLRKAARRDARRVFDNGAKKAGSFYLPRVS